MTFEAATCSLILYVLDGLYDGGNDNDNDNLVDDEQRRNERGSVRRYCRKEQMLIHVLRVSSGFGTGKDTSPISEVHIPSSARGLPQLWRLLGLPSRHQALPAN